MRLDLKLNPRLGKTNNVLCRQTVCWLELVFPFCSWMSKGKYQDEEEGGGGFRGILAMTRHFRRYQEREIFDSAPQNDTWDNHQIQSNPISLANNTNLLRLSLKTISTTLETSAFSFDNKTIGQYTNKAVTFSLSEPPSNS